MGSLRDGTVEAELGGKGQETEHGSEVGEGPRDLSTFSMCAESSRSLTLLVAVSGHKITDPSGSSCISPNPVGQWHSGNASPPTPSVSIDDRVTGVAGCARLNSQQPLMT